MSMSPFERGHGMTFPIVVCACLLAVPANAGSVRFIAADEAAPPPAIAIRTTKGVVNVTDLGPLKRSASYQLSKGADTLLLEATERKGADGKPASVSLAVDPAVKSLLVVILSDAEQATGFRAVILDDGPASFPARLPMLPLDRILAWPKPLVSEVEVHDSPLARVASDHLPLTARLHLAAVAETFAEQRAAA